MSIDKQQVIELYKKGARLSELAKKYGCSRQYINSLVRHLYDGTNSRRKHVTVNLNWSEEYVKKMLESRGAQVKASAYMDVYDLLVAGKYRIEVKHTKSPQSHISQKRKRSQYIYASHGIVPEHFDFLVLIAGPISDRVAYIFPSSESARSMAVPVSPMFKTRRQLRHRNAWHLIPLK